MKTAICTSLITAIFLITSCSSAPKKDTIEKESSNLEPLTEKNLAEKLELLIEREIAFKDVSITYEGLVDEFSDSYKKNFIREGGNIYKDLLPKWSKETQTLITDLNAGDIQVLDTQLKLDREDKEVRGYSGTIEFISNGETILFGFTLLEVRKIFHLNCLRDFEKNL